MLAVPVTAQAADKPLGQIIGGPVMHQGARPSPVWVFVLAAIMGALYIRAIWKTERRPQWWRTTCFFASLVVFVAVVAGPLDNLAWHRVFLAYIAEQILLYMVAAPLLLLGLPEWMVRPVLTRRRIMPIAKLLSRPLVAGGVFTLIFVGLHFPPVCDLVCHARPSFGPIRAVLLATGTVLWWPVLCPLRELRLPRPAQLLYLFVLIAPMTAVGAPITLSRAVIYTWLKGPPVLGMSPLRDEQLGGILMWAGQGVILALAASAIFARWVQEECD